MNASIQQLPFEERVAMLLQASQLPTEDLRDNPEVLLFGCFREVSLAGVVGLELHGPSALLRSLAVSVDQRGQGLGNALLRHAESAAAAIRATRQFGGLCPSSSAFMVKELG